MPSKPPHPLQASELARFERNLENWLKTDPSDAMYHRFQGMLESQIATLQICGVISNRGAAKLFARITESMRKSDPACNVKSSEHFPTS